MLDVSTTNSDHNPTIFKMPILIHDPFMTWLVLSPMPTHWTGSQSSFLTLLILKIKFSNLPTLYRFCLVQTSHNFQQATAVSRAILQFCQLRADARSRCLHVPLHAGTDFPNSSWAICLTLDYVLWPAVWLGGIKSCTTGNRKKTPKLAFPLCPANVAPAPQPVPVFPWYCNSTATSIEPSKPGRKTLGQQDLPATSVESGKFTVPALDATLISSNKEHVLQTQKTDKNKRWAVKKKGPERWNT